MRSRISRKINSVKIHFTGVECVFTTSLAVSTSLGMKVVKTTIQASTCHLPARAGEKFIGIAWGSQRKVIQNNEVLCEETLHGDITMQGQVPPRARGGGLAKIRQL